jgi:hypothetical protein
METTNIFRSLLHYGLSSLEVSLNISDEAEAGMEGVGGGVMFGSIVISLSSIRFFKVMLVSINFMYRV